jgi:hypothetical protein
VLGLESVESSIGSSCCHYDLGISKISDRLTTGLEISNLSIRLTTCLGVSNILVGLTDGLGNSKVSVRLTTRKLVK